MKHPSLLVIGTSGQVDQALASVLATRGIAATFVGRPDVDLLRPETVRKAILEARPTLVVNPAAYTAVDRAEDDEETARAVNAVAPGVVAAAAAEIGAPIIHFSTDYVFDGQKTTPYLEDDPTAPLGVYGATKLAGEQATAAANPRHIMLRTAWVCSPAGSNFVKTMLRLAGERPELTVVADQRGSPTFARDLASAVVAISDRLHGDEPPSPDHFGVFNVASEGLTSWCGFAQAIMEGSRRRGGPAVPVKPITTADYPTRAARPVYSKLSTEKIARTYGVYMPDWRTALETCLDELIGPVTS